MIKVQRSTDLCEDSIVVSCMFAYCRKTESNSEVESGPVSTTLSCTSTRVCSPHPRPATGNVSNTLSQHFKCIREWNERRSKPLWKSVEYDDHNLDY
jgi:hypothetical protein